MKHGWHPPTRQIGYLPRASRTRRLILPLLFSGLCLAHTPAHAAQTYSKSLTFGSSNQGMWNAGPDYQATYTDFWGPSWSGSDSAGDMSDGFGATASASTNGTLGLRAHTYVRGGAVNVGYPIQVTIQYPDAGAL